MIYLCEKREEEERKEENNDERGRKREWHGMRQTGEGYK